MWSRDEETCKHQNYNRHLVDVNDIYTVGGMRSRQFVRQQKLLNLALYFGIIYLFVFRFECLCVYMFFPMSLGGEEYKLICKHIKAK